LITRITSRVCSRFSGRTWGSAINTIPLGAPGTESAVTSTVLASQFIYPIRIIQHTISIPKAMAPYQRRPRDFFTISQNCWENPGQIGSHSGGLKKNSFSEINYFQAIIALKSFLKEEISAGPC
jgi:hypothetical protein